MRAIDRVRLDSCGLELALAAVRNGVGGGEATEPIADPICVTCPNQGLDARFDDGGEFAEERAGVWGGHEELVWFWKIGMGRGGREGDILSPVFEKPWPALLEHSV